MTLECYTPHKFNAKTTALIEQANSTIATYQRAGYSLTLRQLYYWFVSNVEGFENSLKSYKRFGATLSKARLAGLVSWRAINDNHRDFKQWLVQGRVEGALEDVRRDFAPDMWQDQDTYVEVWVEKDALADVIRKPCSKWSVPYMACKGYLSSSEMWAAHKRFQREAYRNCVLIHLGDHDPSGVDMSRDNNDRLNNVFGSHVEIRRIALNMDQVEAYNPPPNPAKITDSRASEYIRKFGDESWELDALEPSVIDKLVSSAIEECVDDWAAWNDRREETVEGRRVLSWIEDHSADVVDWARQEMGE